MKFEKKSNPFTGHEINAPVFEDGSWLFDTAFGHETVAVGYDTEHDAYIIPAHAFRHVPTCTLVEAAEFLGVSKMRVSALCSKGQLNYSKINNVMLIELASVEAYKETRKGYKGVE